MILLLIGLACFLAALRVGGGGRSGAGTDVRAAGAAAWLALIAVLTLLQLASGRDALEGYRITLLGFRYRVETPDGLPRARPLTVSGSYQGSDVWVSGAGEAPLAYLTAVGEGALTSVEARLAADVAAVALVEVPGLFGSTWEVLGGVAVGERDTVVVRAGGSTYRLVAESVADRVSLLGFEVTVPWVREHLLRAVASGDEDALGAALLPGVKRGLLGTLRPYHASVFQRTYPLTDVLQLVDPASPESLPSLTSFFYYRDGELRLADLDSEVDVSGAPEEQAATVWSRDGGGRRFLVAGLPHRDYPEPDLQLPERYGVRPLQSFRADVHGGWLDLALARPEIHSLDRGALDELRLPEGRAPDGTPVYRIRLTPGRNALARQSVAFDAVPAAFAVTSQAIFRLPEETTAGGVEVLTPGGLGRWRTGSPLALGAGDRSLLVRVDGLGTSVGFWLVYLSVALMGALVFLFRPMTGPVFALALAAGGFASFRLVLSLSALARFPFTGEAQQIALWLFPFLPWVVVVIGEMARPGKDADLLTPGAWRRWGFHLAYALVLVSLARVFFPTSLAKQVVLSGLALGVGGIWLALRAGIRPWEGVVTRTLAWIEERPRLVHGWSLGLGLVAGRALLELLGWREQVTLGGTRIGVSVLYTPLVVALLAFLVHRRAVAVSRAPDDRAFARSVSETLLEIGGFLALAYLAVSAWISDFGVALVLLPGALALLAMVGFRWAPSGRTGRMTAATLAAPLLLFMLIQAAPPLLRFAWGGDVGTTDVRLEEWNRNELLLLERGDPEALQMIGQRRSEALAVMRETMRSYTRGNAAGKGFLEGRVSDDLGETATREHAVSALLASQFGLPGTAGLGLLLLSLLAPVLGMFRREEGEGDSGRIALLLLAGTLLLAPVAYVLPSPFNTLVVGLVVVGVLVVLVGPAFGFDSMWMKASDGAKLQGAEESPRRVRSEADSWRSFLVAGALATLSLAGLYMLLANYGLVLFTGKNVYLLGLDSVGDVLESVALLALAAWAMGAAAEGGATSAEGVAVGESMPMWWQVPADSPSPRLGGHAQGQLPVDARGGPRGGSGGQEDGMIS